MTPPLAELTMPATPELLKSLGLSLGLGLLVGLQREWARSGNAGIRTFALTTVFGALSGLLGIAFGPWVVAAGLVGLSGVVVLGHLAELRRDAPDLGLTTEVAMLVMFATGAAAMLGFRIESVIVAGGVMVLLHSKEPLHDMVARIGREDLREIARLVLLGLVILPLLPNREMGSFGVLNPFSIWLMVTLIVGMSLTAYLIGKFVGGKKGAILAGVLGGMISSTATTASLARHSRKEGAGGILLAAVVTIASTVVFVRVAVEVAVVAPGQMKALLPPLLGMMAWCSLVGAALYHFSSKSGFAFVGDKPPSELRTAIVLGLLYAVVLVVVAAAREYLGESGLYLAALLSGLTDMDAITLSTAKMVGSGHIESDTGWRMILVGGLANLLFKGGMAAMLGARDFVRPLLGGFGAMLLGGLAILLLWP